MDDASTQGVFAERSMHTDSLRVVSPRRKVVLITRRFRTHGCPPSYGHTHHVHASGRQRAVSGHVFRAGARAQVGAVRGGNKGTCNTQAVALQPLTRSRSCFDSQNRVNDAAKQAQLCKCVGGAAALATPSALTAVISSRLDVDAGLQTIGVMRDIGSPTLRKCVTYVCAQSIEFVLISDLECRPTSMNQSIASASRSLSKLKIKRGLS